MRSLPKSCVPILVALALLLSGARNGSAESRNPRGNQHKGTTAEEPKKAQQRQQEPVVPLSVLQTTQSALSEALHTIRTQEEAAAKHDRTQQDNWDKAAVIADYLLFIVGCLYTYFAWGQWSEIENQANIAKTATQITMEAQRGHVFGLPMTPIQNFVAGQEPRIFFGLKNVGGTKISDCMAETWVEVLEKPFVDFSDKAYYVKNETRINLYQNAPDPPTMIIMRWNHPLTDQQVRDIQADKWALCIRVRIQYRDAFGATPTQNFGFSTNSVTWEGLPKYND